MVTHPHLNKAGEKKVVILSTFYLCSASQAAGEVKALEDFYKMLQHEPDRAFYG